MRTRFLSAVILVIPGAGVVGQPGPFPEADLIYARNICSDTTISFPNLLVGNVVDLDPLNRGCLLSNERNGTWAIFEVATGGMVGFTVIPSLPQTDLDFAVWGPSPTWPNVLSSPPVRCSYSALAGLTGMGGAAIDASEGPGGDGWVAYLNVNAGDHFALFIDNYDMSGSEAQLVWDLVDGATLTCLELPHVSFGIEGGDIIPGGSVDMTAYASPDVYAFYWQLPGSTIGTSLERDPMDVQYDLPGCYDVTLNMYNAAGENSSTASCVVNVVLPTSMAVPSSSSAISFDGDQLSVRPSGTGVSTVSVMDALGRSLLQRTGAGRMEITLSEWSGNMVLIVVEQEGSRQVHRLVLP